MEIKSILIEDTTREERIRIVQEDLNQCGGACDFCNGCDNLGLSLIHIWNICDSGTLTDSDYNQRYIFNILLFFTME